MNEESRLKTLKFNLEFSQICFSLHGKKSRGISVSCKKKIPIFETGNRRKGRCLSV